MPLRAKVQTVGVQQHKYRVSCRQQYDTQIAKISNCETISHLLYT